MNRGSLSIVHMTLRAVQGKMLSPLYEKKGVALIMVLWVIAILSVVVLEFCFAMRTEVHIANNYKEELQAYAMAEGGVQRAIAELIYKHDSRVQQTRRALKLEEVSPDRMEWVTDGRPYLLPLAQGACEVRVMSEAGKVNINVVTESLLRMIIGQMGLEGEERDIVVDSILDWRDPNDFTRLHGAENDYYLSLKEPYYCKNGHLDSIEELLLVRGVTPDLFHGSRPRGLEEGSAEKIGLKDIFSIYSPGQQIDINSAPPIVLNVVLGLPRGVARLVVNAREEKGFENQQDLLLRVPEVVPFIGEIRRGIVYRSTLPYYTVESRGKLKGGGSMRGLKTIVKIDPREKEGYKVIQWVDRLAER